QFGEEMYRKAIKTYIERHALGNVVTDDLRQVFEEVSGKPLDRFFDQWVFHAGMPELKISYKWLPEEKQALVTIEQVQETNDKIMLFEFDTVLRFIVDGKEYDEAITVDGKKHDFYVKLPAEPQVVRFDPEYTLLAKIDFDKS